MRLNNVEAKPEYYWDIMPLTFGRARLVWTDGIGISDSY